jgi:hypothetical protein
MLTRYGQFGVIQQRLGGIARGRPGPDDGYTQGPSWVTVILRSSRRTGTGA